MYLRKKNEKSSSRSLVAIQRNIDLGLMGNRKISNIFCDYCTSLERKKTFSFYYFLNFLM